MGTMKVDGTVITREQLRYERLTARTSDPLTGIQMHERNVKYTEVIDPRTGFCTDVVNVFTAEAPVVAAGPCVKGSGAVGPRFEKKSGLYVTGAGASRRVVRTVDMGDEPLPTRGAGARVGTTKGERRESAKAKVKRAPKDSTQAQTQGKKTQGRPKGQGNKGTGPSRAEIKAFVKDFCGYEGSLSPQMLRAARAAMAHAAQKAEYTQGR